MNEPLLLSVREAARVAGVGRDTMYELIRSGRVRAVRVGEKKNLVPRSELERWIERELLDEHGTND